MTASDDDDSAVPSTPPNVLLLIIDDFGVGNASLRSVDPCYAVGDVSDDPTLPVLAELCAAGRVFETAWASPTCSPTRASVLTGTLPHQHGVFAPSDTYNQIDPASAWTLPRALADGAAGYDTANVGKWHLSPADDDPRVAGWGHFAGVIRGALPDYRSWDRTVDGVTATTETYATTANIDDSLAWIDARDGDAPWFLWLAVNAPHEPWHVPPLDLHSFDDLADYADQQRATPWFKATMQALDTELGRLLAGLEERGERDDTVVMVIGDNGTARSAADPVFGQGRSKGSLNEGGIRVPMFIAGPGIIAGRSGELVTVADLFPTVIELAGLEPESLRAAHAPDIALFGRSLLPLLRGGQPTDWRTHLLVTSRPSPGPSGGLAAGTAVRDATHKLICHDDGEVELFDLGADAFEDDDLFDSLETLPDDLAPVYSSLHGAAEVVLGAPLACP